VQDLPADRIGVIAFAGQSYLWHRSPGSLGGDAVSADPRPDLASAGGTDLAAVFRQAAAVLQDTPEGGDRAVVLFTDGRVTTHSRPRPRRRGPWRGRVRLIMVAQGSELPVRIPSGIHRDLTEYQRDAEGEEVMTARRDAQLRAIVEASGGLLIPAERADRRGRPRGARRAEPAAAPRAPAGGSHPARLGRGPGVGAGAAPAHRDAARRGLAGLGFSP